MSPDAGPARYLLVSNSYPDEGALYRSNFIHARVKAYQAAGKDVEVFLVGPTARFRGYTHDGVEVTVGDVADYTSHLQRNRFTKILVHFAHQYMLDPILTVCPEVPVIVWVHGFESEAWHRRWFNLIDDAGALRSTLERRETHFKPQLEFMRWLFTTEQLDVTVVQVSRWFKEHISETDVGARARKSVVIPNVIDTSRFSYREKSPQERLQLLSIRPYSSHKYANDLTVDSILELSRRPFFNELQFELYGDGYLRERTVAPLKDMPNVRLFKHFLTQPQITDLHARHGVFLAPTRFDAQGVSTCEAMSSGLVPISTRIAAVPEYVQHDVSGLLAAPESSSDIADLVEEMYHDPDRFQRLSATASQAIREQCGPHATTDKELELIES